MSKTPRPSSLATDQDSRERNVSDSIKLPPTLNETEPHWGKAPEGQDSQEATQQTGAEHSDEHPSEPTVEDLARMLAQKEGELGAYREHLAALQQNPNLSDNSASDQDELASLLEKVTAASEQGGNVMETLVRGLAEHLEGKTTQAITAQQARSQRIEQIQNEVMAKNPDAEGMKDVLRQVYSERPHLIPLDGSDEDIKRGVQDIIDLARARRGPSPQRRPVQLDPGTGGRVSRPQAKKQRWQELQDKAVRTGRMQDWAEANKARMFGS